MKETELRIQKYKALLPRARERVIAALMIFVFSIAMLTVSTFSWITLSVAPEVSGATTTIAANGNLEIALARDILLKEDGTPMIDEDGNVIAIPPSASAIGDSLLSITQKNLTWGNIVNLSDASYGLENITLRPATLNTSSLLAHPLYSATYGVDGRIKELINAFEYTQYNSESSEFTKSHLKGIKAISSVDYIEVDVPTDSVKDFIYQTTLGNAGQDAGVANGNFLSLNVSGANYRYMQAVGGLLSSYADGVLTGADNTVICSADDVAGFYDLLVFLDEAVMVPIGEALIDIFEVYQINTYGIDGYERFESVDVFCTTVEQVLAEMNDKRDDIEGLERVVTGDKLNVNSSTSNKKFYEELNTALASNDEFNALFPFIADITKLRSCIKSMEDNGYVTFQDGQTVGSANVTWGNIQPIVDYLVTIDGKDGVLLSDGSTSKTINDWIKGLGITEALALFGLLGKTPGDNIKSSVTVQSGLIERIDKMLFGFGKGSLIIDYITIKIKSESLKAKAATVAGSMSGLANRLIDNASNNGFTYINAKLTTNASGDTTKCIIKSDIDNAKTASGFKEVVRDYVARDTYGLSIDFWLRTNAPQSFLTLEGEVVYTYIDVKVTIDGTEYQVYVTDVTTQTPKVDENGNPVVDENGNPIMENTVFEDQEVYFAPKKDGAGNVWYYYMGNTPVEGTVTEPDMSENSDDKLQTKEVAGYVGANRIWTEEELETMSEMEYRTTQGMGSCYTFYAEPGEKGQILDILKAFKVAFVDSNGTLLATASLATEYCFSEYGKYVVPLMLDENAIDTGEDTEEGDDIRAIMSLEQNVPTLITALVYLDGDVVSNDKVLSSSDIQGQLNLQFGNTYEPQPLDDEELMSETLKITAKVTDAQGKENPQFYFKDTEKSFTATVELSVEGEAPKTITANFLRKITTTQGTRGETIEFTQSASDPTKWTATATFTAPGEYILRSVFADGIERKLTNVVDTGNAEAVKVIVHGFSVSGFSGDPNLGLTHEYMTASDYVTESFSVNISAYENGTLTPGSVKGVFINEDNVAVTINFTETQSGSGRYTGTATFVSDGTYTLENIMVDGLYYSVGSTYTREVRTKLSVAVWLTHDDSCCDITEIEGEFEKVGNDYKFIFDRSHDFFVKMKVYDSTGQEIIGLVEPKLTYTKNATADLEWSTADGGCYVGYIPVDSVGEYKFVSASVNGENITKAISASVVTAISRDPAEFSNLILPSGEEVIVINGSNAQVAVGFKNGDSAIVYGLFEKEIEGATTKYLISAEKDTENEGYYIFTLPDEDGYWTLKEVYATNVAYRNAEGEIDFFQTDPLKPIFKGNGNAVEITDKVDEETSMTVEQMIETAASGYYFVVEDELANRNTTIKVIATYKLTHNIGANGGVQTVYGADVDATGKVTKKTGAFMESHNVNAIEFTITDFEGKQIANNVTLSLKKEMSTTKANGRYTYEAASTVEETLVTITSADNITFKGNALSLKIAGDYVPTATITLRDMNNTSFDVELPKLSVYSVTPSVKISAVSPSTSMGVDTSSDGKGYTTKTNSKTDTSATVYMECTIHETGLFTKTKRYCYQSSTVSIQLLNSGYASDATLSFGTGTPLYTTWYDSWGRGNYTSDGTNSYNWGENNTNKNGCDGEKTLYIGYSLYSSSELDYRNGSKTPAGTLTATELVLTYDGKEYVVPVSITINNPY
ncbi:MAG: hypothetical protein J6D11_06195 [Clostridia bacterium]|nr:hypothetical protein [Clostridia bacterium]